MTIQPIDGAGLLGGAVQTSYDAARMNAEGKSFQATLDELKRKAETSAVSEAAGYVPKNPMSKEELEAKKLHEACDATDPMTIDYFMQNLQGALPAISLPSQLAISTAFSNDQAPDLTFAQQVLGLGTPGDVLLGITTSGNSKNVLYAFRMAKALGMKTIALTGAAGGKCTAGGYADITIHAPSDETYKIQEYHLPIYHTLCIAVEEEFFGAA